MPNVQYAIAQSVEQLNSFRSMDLKVIGFNVKDQDLAANLDYNYAPKDCTCIGGVNFIQAGCGLAGYPIYSALERNGEDYVYVTDTPDWNSIGAMALAAIVEGCGEWGLYLDQDSQNRVYAIVNGEVPFDISGLSIDEMVKAVYEWLRADDAREKRAEIEKMYQS